MFSGFFFMIFLIFLFIFIIGSSIIRSILGLLFGHRPPHQRHAHTEQSHQTHSQSQARQSASTTGKRREKIFDKSEGEYVDFEEVK